MYTLRKIDPKDVETNFGLGEVYTFISREQTGSGADFNKALSSHLGKEIGTTLTDEEIKAGNEIFGFVFTEFGKMLPMQQKCKYYIMTDSGKTFCNLSFKE